MGIDIKINGKLEQFASAYSVQEDSTPVDPSDSSGGVGQFTFTVPTRDDTKMLRGKVADLEDGSQGTTQGTITGVSGDRDNATVTADSRLGALNVGRTAQPYVGTLGGAFRYYLSLVGVTERIVVDETIEDRPVVLPGWSGNAWDFVGKKLCAAEQVEVSLVSDYAVMRPLRGRIAENHRNSVLNWAIDGSSVARSVEVLIYNSEKRDAFLAYPLGGWTPEVKEYQVDAGEVLEVDIPLAPNVGDEGYGASLSSVDQPVCIDWVDRHHSSSSVYSVSGGDYLPIKAAQWTAGGGRVDVKINDDTTSLTVTITGSTETQYAPYRIAMSAGPSDQYSSLRLVGSGVFFTKRKMTFVNGLSEDEAPQEVGATIDNEAIRTEEMGFRAGSWALERWTGPKRSITVTTTGINRKGVSGNLRYPTIADVNAAQPGWTIGQWNARWGDKIIGDFNEWLFDMVRSDFDNQAFGNVAGARVFDDYAFYRIRSVAALTPSSISYTAERDTLIGDHNEIWGDSTIGDWNAEWGNKTIGDVNTRPLYRTPPPTPEPNKAPWPDTFFPDIIYPA